MSEFEDIVWWDGRNKLVLSPRSGGRVLSWGFNGKERVTPLLGPEGGLLRFIFGEERFPGASYVVPHEVVSQEEWADGFRVHLRHCWSTPNQFMRKFDWPEKIAPTHLDGLLLDKIVTFTANTPGLIVEMTVRNLTDEVKYLTPWLHNSFARWSTRNFVVRDGQQEAYQAEENYWGGHVAGDARSMRSVLCDEKGFCFAVLGTSADLLIGHFAHALPAEIPADQFAQASLEARYADVALQPGEQWHSNAFLVFTTNWQPWATDAPVELFTRIETVDSAPWDISSLLPTLSAWALPEEQEQGLMILSSLEDPPFSLGARPLATYAFSDFQTTEHGAEAHVILFAVEELNNLRAEVRGADGWKLAVDDGGPMNALQFYINRHDYRKLRLIGPENLAGKETVSVRLSQAGIIPTTLCVKVDSPAETASSVRTNPPLQESPLL